ncbi:MAG: hypothetical protein NC432_05230 [Roseburia sp.]|nr:hypothetical protein [Roseburia sp.]MCM1097910.1 hypothetical protein [Ruminococcus flavefaciens]
MGKEKKLRIAIHILTALYGAACLWLFYRQSIADLTVAGEIPYQSDLPLHISMIIEDGWYYSFTAYAYRLLYAVCGGSTLGIAAFLAAVCVGTVYAAEALVCRLGEYREKSWGTLLLSLSLNFVMPIYIRAVGEFRYVSYQSGNIWHNSTYLCMRLAALLTFLYYLRLEEKYRQGITWKEWCAFALLNILCTGIKPSFLVAFSPIMGIFLLADLIRRTPLRRVLVFGSALLPSGLVLLWQNAVLFGEETGNGIAFRPWYIFSLHAAITKLAVICSALFCILTVIVTLGQLRRDRRYLFIVLMAALGFLEALCLVEEGSRAVDGNFLWGYSFCLFVLFAACAVKCLGLGRAGATLSRMKREGLSGSGEERAENALKLEGTGQEGSLKPDEAESGSDSDSGGIRLRKILRLGLGLVYGWHLYCGLYYFVRLVGGASFWMR